MHICIVLNPNAHDNDHVIHSECLCFTITRHMLANYCMPFSRECPQCMCVCLSVCACVCVCVCICACVCLCLCVCVYELYMLHINAECSYIINNYIKVEDYLGHIMVDQAGLIRNLNYDLDMTQIFNRSHVFR